jgi:hypothetical protein
MYHAKEAFRANAPIARGLSPRFSCKAYTGDFPAQFLSGTVGTNASKGSTKRIYLLNPFHACICLSGENPIFAEK